MDRIVFPHRDGDDNDDDLAWHGKQTRRTGKSRRSLRSALVPLKGFTDAQGLRLGIGILL
jgi:hypothetical protein